eukprot:CAMPEP_0168522290 /NCGR_PEP_ID=MMETSP0405-20121227/9255_1 /TAXON_ID=498012 /ORGANISM="Trichosphaerium sp, Strain Am-I-7 wt" /LENGTH=172 /DNA_ID=CAMNT_0008543855 /DNA_START=612 /DNA_END=1126 /DNA_ORIENTATION=+
MREDFYVPPATHAGGPSSTDPFSPIYGVRLRLKASFNESSFTANQKVVLQALKKYGMFLADGGNIPLTAASDMGRSITWDMLMFGTRDIDAVQPDDFEVVNYDTPVALTRDCVKNTIEIKTCPSDSTPTMQPNSSIPTAPTTLAPTSTMAPTTVTPSGNTPSTTSTGFAVIV